LFGEKEDLEMFSQMYASVMKYLRKGRSCRDVLQQEDGLHSTPYFVNVDYSTGRILNYWMDALSASFAAVQVLAGDIEEAICTHAVYYSIWRRYSALPERFDWNTKSPNVKFYPLRPELVESTYLLYQATQNPFYLHVGSDILHSLEKYTKTSCGYATLHDITTKTKEDRMESFFLSETCKYLYLLFDTDNVVNRYSAQFVFTTEGHVIQLDPALRHRPWDRDTCHDCFLDNRRAIARINESFVSHSCPVYEQERRYALPLSRQRLGEIEALVGLKNTPATNTGG
jgi:mannosidase alpha-like ER degradation enhancer 1